MKKFLITILVFVVVQISTTATIINSNQNLSNKLQDSSINFNIKVFKKALNNNDTVVLNNIIESGVDPNLTRFGKTILSYAISSGNIYAVEKLLKAGADANKMSRGVTPLSLAIKNKQPKIVEMLINSGADVNKLNKVQFLNDSIYDGCVNSIIILDPALKPITPDYTPLIPTMNIIYPTPIFFAIKTGQLDIVVMLINAGANLSYVNQGGLNPLDYAICLDQADIVEKLIETGAVASSAIYVEHAKKSRDEKIKTLDIPLFYQKPLYKNVNFYIKQK